MRTLAILFVCCAVLAVRSDDVDTNTTTSPVDPTSPSNTSSPTTAPVSPTISPVTNSTVSPTTTTPPLPPHPDLPKASDYVLKGKDNVTCIMAHFGAQFVIPYTNVANESVIANLNVVNGTVADASSACEVNATSLNLVVNFDDGNTVTFTFVKDGDNRYVKTVQLAYKPDETNFPGFNGKDLQNLKFENQSLFSVKGDQSYKCKDDEGHGPDDAAVKFGDVQVDAFRTATDAKFRKAFECAADEQVNDLVPIAVGCALLALVVIVLIAYFIGRRRSRRLAYQSV